MTDQISKTLSPSEASRAIYVDFEGTTNEPACLLGVLIDDDFTQYVLHPVLRPAGKARAKGGGPDRWCVNADLTALVEQIVAQGESERRLIVAFSRHDLEVMKVARPDLSDELTDRYRDGKATAKRWARQAHPSYQFRSRARGGRHTLDQFLGLADYEVPKAFGPGNTGQRLKYTMDQLRHKDGDFESLTPVAKGKWTRVLKHNYHDVHGLRDLCEVAADYLER